MVKSRPEPRRQGENSGLQTRNECHCAVPSHSQATYVLSNGKTDCMLIYSVAIHCHGTRESPYFYFGLEFLSI